ncbi:uncharacterized protein [Prorops nasuta]|uniref:uncharacterized protein n=1 Tax=Prorops nasuta TaxID=863751 RepID=UPI0034CE5B75
MSAREVTLVGGSPWGFRMHGGHDLHQPLRISRVNPGSKAAQQGVREGDLISSINGRSTRELTNTEAHALLRNAGDNLKLGLNQENASSPKKRIYKSSLQENTSTEILKKTTTTTTTSKRIVSPEPKKNGIDVAKSEQSYVSQNGGPKNSVTSQRTEKKNAESCCSLGYATDVEEIRMPRNRKRRNRKKKLQIPPAPDGIGEEIVKSQDVEYATKTPNDSVLENSDEKIVQVVTDREDSKLATLQNEGLEDVLNGLESPCESGSCEIGNWDLIKNEGTKITNTDINNCEKENGELMENQDSKISNTEINNCEEGNGDLIKNTNDDTNKIEEEDTRVINETNNNESSHENSVWSKIQEISKCIINEANNNWKEDQGTGSVSKENAEIVNKSSQSTRTNEANQSLNSSDNNVKPSIANLESFKENGGELKITTEQSDHVKPKEVKRIRKKQTIHKKGYVKPDVKIVEVVTLDSCPLEAKLDHILGVGIVETSSKKKTKKEKEIEDSRVTISEPLESMEPLSQSVNSKVELLGKALAELANDSDRLEIHEVSDSDIEIDNVRPTSIVIETESDIERDPIDQYTECDQSDRVYREISSFDSSESTVSEALSQTSESEESKGEIEARESTCLTNVQNGEVGEPSMSKEVESKLRTFIEGLQLPSATEEAKGDAEEEEESKMVDARASVKQRKANKRAILESYYAHSQAANRFLDIIQEEGEKLSEGNERHIRDFINEEIGKYRRKERENDPGTSSLGNADEKINESLGNTWEVTNAKQDEIVSTEKKQTVLMGEYSRQNNSNSSISDLNADRRSIFEKDVARDKGKHPPIPPRRSSSVDNEMDPPRPPTPPEIDYPSSTPVNSRPKLAPAPPVRKRLAQKRSKSRSPPERPPPPKLSLAKSLQYVYEPICNTSALSLRKLNPFLISSFFGPRFYGNHDVPWPGDVASVLPRLGGLEKALFPSTIDRGVPRFGMKGLFLEYPRELDSAESDSFIKLRNARDSAGLGNEASSEIARDHSEEETLKKFALLASPETSFANRSLELSSNSNKKNPTRDSIAEEGAEENCGERSSSAEALKVKIETAGSSDGNYYGSEESDVERLEEKRDGEAIFDLKTQSPDFQGQDSSSSTTSLSTVKQNPFGSSIGDISLIEHDSSSTLDTDGTNDVDTCKLRNKLQLLKIETPVAKTNESVESPQPIPYSPVEDYLYYVPLDSTETTKSSKRIHNENANSPRSLKDLCIEKILSMPFGLRIINEITLSKFNIFKYLQSIEGSAKVEKDRPYGVEIHEEAARKHLIESSDIVSQEESKINNDRSIEREDRDSREEMNRPKSWVGVPTSEDPKLLLCLSPSQQESNVKTSADKLLDLHEKFLNRHSYHGDAHPQKVSVPKYHIDLQPIKTDREKHEDPEKSQKTKVDKSYISNENCRNRLLEIIKENTESTYDKRDEVYNGFISEISDKPYHSDSEFAAKRPEVSGQDRLKVTRLCDWLNLARRDPLNLRRYDDLLIDQQRNGVDKACSSWRNNVVRNDGPVTPGRMASQRNGLLPRKTLEDARAKMDLGRERLKVNRYGKVFEDLEVEKEKSGSKYKRYERALEDAEVEPKNLGSRKTGEGHFVNSALIASEAGGSPIRVSPVYSKSPISLNSAIIDKYAVPEVGKPTPVRRSIDFRHNVNPALIDDKPRVPPKTKRVITVDKSCIDTTSIFDQAPPRNHLASKRSNDLENLKLETATQILQNLKKLQADMSHQRSDQRTRYSLPHEYFEKQMKLIELLEDQLKNVLLDEEEENQICEEFHRKLHEVTVENSKLRDVDNEDDSFFNQEFDRLAKEVEQSLNGETNNDTRRWSERSKLFEDFTSNDQIKSADENGDYEEEIIERLEFTEERQIVTKLEIQDVVPSVPESEQLEEFGEIRGKREIPVSSPVPMNGEIFRQQMYDEYVNKVLEREERKQNKVIKISSHTDIDKSEDQSMSAIEKEFIDKAKNRLSKFGISLDDNVETLRIEEAEKNEEKEEERMAKCLIDGKEIEDARKLPKHLQEFLEISMDEESVMFAPTFKASSAKPGVWSPGSEPPPPPKQPSPERNKSEKDVIPPVWTPGNSPLPERKEFRPVQFESPILSRKKIQSEQSGQAPPPWAGEDKNQDSQSQDSSGRIVNSHSVPSQGLSSFSSAPRLPRAQNPTITLLQKAREGQLPKGAAYLQENETVSRLKNEDKPLISPGEIIYTLKKEYESEPESENEPPKKMADLAPRKFEGIGPMTREGVPLVLRSEVKENNQAKWYKKMYDSLHRTDKDDDYITIRYKPRRGARYGYGSSSGYLSEPEPRGYSDRSATLDNRRRLRNKENEFTTSTIPRKSGALKYSPEVYKNQPGRIEDYEPGRSSIAEKEAKEWWDEVMDIFDGWLDENGQENPREPEGRPREGNRVLSLSYRPTSSHSPFDQRNAQASRPYISHALKESGYESDSTLVFRRREDVSPLSPLEQRLAYKTVQRGGDVPLHGLRKPAPERPKDDTQIEYFPISPTLTRIRVHRTSGSSSRGSSSASSMIASRCKRSLATSSSPGIMRNEASKVERLNFTRTLPTRSSSLVCLRPPSPPRRKSSKNNRTLKLFSTIGQHPSNSRHEQCFTDDTVSNIRLLRERFSSNLERHRRERERSQSLRLSRASSTSPICWKDRTEKSQLTRSLSETITSNGLLSSQEKIKSKICSSNSPKLLPGDSTKVNLKSIKSRVPSKCVSSNTKEKSQKISTKSRLTRKEQEESCKRLSRSADFSQKLKEREAKFSQGRTRQGNSMSSHKSGRSTDRKVDSVSLSDIGIRRTTILSPDTPIILRRVADSSKITERLASSRESLRSVTSTHRTDSPGEINKRKRARAKPQTIVRSPTRKREVIVINSQSGNKRTSREKSDEKNRKTKEPKNGLRKKRVKKSANAGKSGEKGSSEQEISPLTIEEIRKHQEATRSNSFFQNLFLRNMSPTPSQSSTLKKSFIEERLKFLQDYAKKPFKSEPSLKSLNIYLSQKRPVSNSRFKNWEQESCSSRSSSPFGTCWPGRSIFQRVNSRFGCVLGVDEFGSSTSLRGPSPDLEYDVKERSLSEPPLRTTGGETDSRHTRTLSPSPVRSPACRRIQILKQQQQEKPDVPVRKKLRARSVSDAEDLQRRSNILESNILSGRSTSSLCASPVDREDYHQYILELLHSRRKSKKYKDLHDFYESLERMGQLMKTTSSNDLRPRMKNEEIIDYERWRRIRTKEKAEKELETLYGKLLSIQKNKDFIFTVRDMDKYKWHGDCGLRCKERSVENIKQQFQKLENEESDLENCRRREISARKDVYKPLWRGSSVINFANNMQQRANESPEADKTDYPYLQRNFGGSKKFWSSLSIEQVNALKNQLNDIYGSENNKTSSRSDVERGKSIPVTKDEANESKAANLEENSSFEIIVPPPAEFGDGSPERRGLHVRCHSAIAPSRTKSTKTEVPLFRRSDSIAQSGSLEKKIPVAPSTPLTEHEKKRLSLTLSKEVLDKMKERSSLSPVTPRETRGAIAAASATAKTPRVDEKSDFIVVLKPDNSPLAGRRMATVMESWSKKPPLLTVQLPSHSSVKASGASGSEVDSATESSETSVGTVVQRSADPDVPRIVEFFESIELPKDIHSGERNSANSRLSGSQSFADLKELFGESKSAVQSNFSKARSISPRGGVGGRGSDSPSPETDGNRRSLRFSSCDRQSRSHNVSPCRPNARSDSSCSLESLLARSSSPDPERYYRAYLKLARSGSVRRLRGRFESAEDLPKGRSRVVPTPKRFQSDPELTRSLLKRAQETGSLAKVRFFTDVDWLRKKFEPPRRVIRRRGESPPIPRVPLRLEDLNMPHINIISKTAELKDFPGTSTVNNSQARRAETKELESKKPVGTVRNKFERLWSDKTSILGEMFTSTPDVHELRDITPYLTGQWVAHQYPRRQDNMRSLSSPPKLESRSTPPRDSTVKTVESSRVTGRTKKRVENPKVALNPPTARARTPTSILKHTDVFANQPFDPSKHRPKFRYQPPPPPPSPSTSIARRDCRTWWPPLSTYNARPTVTFEEYSNAPPPPPKSHHYRDSRQESPRRYVEGEVTIHYRSPVRTEAKEPLSEEELARRSAENMRRVYQEERRRKYLQELHDIDSRRHTDNFIQSQKSPIPLNRYDDFVDDLSHRSRSQEQTPEPRLVARALYNFVGQSSRELTFRRGDIIFVRRQVDKNWYEGEHNAMIGLFPFNYVEILPYDGIRTTPRKSYEGRARAKFNFVAQTNLELSLARGEIVVLTRRVDENWYEGRIGNRKGIFPISYVEVLSEPGTRPETPVQSKPVASPAAHSLLVNGSAGGKLSMGSHHYTPSMPVNLNTTQPHYNSLPRMGGNKLYVAPINETLHIDTHSEPLPYRALYNYRPQNEDELELKEGDTVYVMEKCDDGWYVGSSQRTGYFGTFPGNYVEQL